MSTKAPFYRGVRGGAAPATRRIADAAPAAEALAPGEMRRVPYAGELLGAVRVRARFAAGPSTLAPASSTPTPRPTRTSTATHGATPPPSPLPRAAGEREGRGRWPRPVHTDASLARALAVARGRIAASIETVRRRAARARAAREETA